MPHQNSNDIKREDSKFNMVLAWMAVAATAITSIAGLVSFV